MIDNTQIPKIIHYCWFGKHPLPESALRCIESWKKFCPDYEIRRWDESNYDVSACAYIQEAYAAGKWAFVSDYARFDILHSHGGVYFDTDVEMIGPINDILSRGPYMGAEQNKTDVLVAPGLGMASGPEHPIFKRILSDYQNMHFLKPDGTYNQTTVVKYTTDILREYGLTNSADMQRVAGIWIYPWDYFCPMEYSTGKLTITPNTRTIHHYTASWFTKEEQAARRVTLKAAMLLGEKAGRRFGKIYSFPRRVRKKVKEKGFWGAACCALKKYFG